MDFAAWVINLSALVLCTYRLVPACEQVQLVPSSRATRFGRRLRCVGNILSRVRTRLLEVEVPFDSTG